MAGSAIQTEDLQVSGFDVVLDGSTAKLVVSGFGSPRVVVLTFDAQRVFELAGKMLQVCDKIDHAQLVASLRQVASQVTGSDAKTQDPSATVAAPVQPAPDESTRDQDDPDSVNR